MRGPDEWSERSFVALAVALPLLLLAVHVHLGHHGDIEFFHRWYLAVRESNAFYRDGPGINYPIVGVLLVAGPARLVDLALGHPLSLDVYWLVLKVTLVVGEIAAVLLGARLARALGHPQPRLLSVLLYLLPSTWAGGAWFGQIDVWGTVALLAAAEAAVAYDLRAGTGALVRALLALMVAILIKQLTWFAVPALAALVARGLWTHGTARHRALAALSPVLLVLADPWLALPEGQWSHVLFVLTHGSSHGDVVVASGASLWSLAFPGGTESSAVQWLGMNAQTWGWIAFGAALLGLVALLARRGPTIAARDLVLAAGLSELLMALLLTGVHERYLAHAIPLLWLARGVGASRASVGLAVGVGIVSGLFVLSTITPALPSFFGGPAPTAVLSSMWAVALATELARRARR